MANSDELKKNFVEPCDAMRIQNHSVLSAKPVAEHCR